MTLAEPINPEIMRWARERAGLSLVDAARKLGLRDGGRASAAEKLQDIEDGSAPIALERLEKAAGAYARPLATFYLPAPPAHVPPAKDFRLQTGQTTRRQNALLEALVRDVVARQSLVRGVLQDEEDAGPLGFIGTFDVADGAQRAADAIRRVLAVTSEAQRRSGDAERFFGSLRQAAGAAGIYVLLLGDLGTHHTDLDAQVFRGFALADRLAPFVVINDNDAPAARSFTLIHELAHLWIGESGISGPLAEMPTSAVERFCNETAELFLLPAEALAGIKGPLVDREVAAEVIGDIAQAWKVSRLVVTYRMARQHLVSRAMTSELFALFRQSERRVKPIATPDEGGPGYYVVRRSRLGTALLGTVRRALQEDVLTHTRAAKILGVRPTAVSRLLAEPRRAA